MADEVQNTDAFIRLLRAGATGDGFRRLLTRKCLQNLQHCEVPDNPLEWLDFLSGSQAEDTFAFLQSFSKLIRDGLQWDRIRAEARLLEGYLFRSEIDRRIAEEQTRDLQRLLEAPPKFVAHVEVISGHVGDDLIHPHSPILFNASQESNAMHVGGLKILEIEATGALAEMRWCRQVPSAEKVENRNRENFHLHTDRSRVLCLHFEIANLRLWGRVEVEHVAFELECTSDFLDGYPTEIRLKRMSLKHIKIDGYNLRVEFDDNQPRFFTRSANSTNSVEVRMQWENDSRPTWEGNAVEVPGLGSLRIGVCELSKDGFVFRMLQLKVAGAPSGIVEVGKCTFVWPPIPIPGSAPYVRTSTRTLRKPDADGDLRTLLRGCLPDHELASDLNHLAHQKIFNARDLLSARPGRVMGCGRIRWSNLAKYRLVALNSLFKLHKWARHRLSVAGWQDYAIQKLSGEAAIRIVLEMDASSHGSGDWIVQMADVLPRERLVELTRAARLEFRQSHATETQADLFRRLELNRDRTFQAWLSNQFIGPMNSFQIQRTAEHPGVRSVSPVLPMRSCINEAVQRVSLQALRSVAKGKGEIVAVIDSGVDASHPDLSGRVVYKRDYTGLGCSDDHGHGTHLAGVIGADCPTYGGVAPEVTIWSYRILNQDGESSNSGDAIKAIHDVVVEAKNLDKVLVVNASIEIPHGSGGTDIDYETLCDAFDDATTDVVVVAAAGNSGPAEKSITAPGGGNSVITVGASVNRPSGWPDVVSAFSSRGPSFATRLKPDIVAPGGFENREKNAYQDVSMVSCRVANSTLDKLTGPEKPWLVDPEHYGISGTSQATAVVSGICALILEEMSRQGRTVTHSQIANALKKSARPLGYGQYEEGKGLVNVDEAIKLI